MKSLLVTMYVLATASISYGLYGLEPEAQYPYAKLFEVNQTPMYPHETIDLLIELKSLTKDELVTKRIQSILNATDIKVDQCNFDRFKHLEKLYEGSRYGSCCLDEDPPKGTLIANVAKMVHAQIDALYKLCDDEYREKLEKILKSISIDDLPKLTDLVESIRDPLSIQLISSTSKPYYDIVSYLESLGEFVERKAGRDALMTVDWHRLRKPKLDEKKYEKAYKKHVIDTCARFESIFGSVMQIGASLRNREPFGERYNKFHLFKNMRICEYAKDSCENSFKALKNIHNHSL